MKLLSVSLSFLFECRHFIDNAVLYCIDLFQSENVIWEKPTFHSFSKLVSCKPAFLRLISLNWLPWDLFQRLTINLKLPGKGIFYTHLLKIRLLKLSAFLMNVISWFVMMQQQVVLPHVHYTYTWWCWRWWYCCC